MRRLLITLALAGACHASPRPPPAPARPLPRAAYAHYLAGKMAMYQQDWAAATVSLAAARAAAPDEPMIVVELARAQVKAKDLVAASVTL
ncbi:MAG: hypothetical protein H0T79_18525, partial [Deltaproteobacteria bacterium]|nr:hypothetical protein [Deltaproteobacteria bacterium]